MAVLIVLVGSLLLFRLLGAVAIAALATWLASARAGRPPMSLALRVPMQILFVA